MIVAATLLFGLIVRGAGVIIALPIPVIIFIKLDCEPAPMLLAYILGPMTEEVHAPGIAALPR